jgi:hypothetical protein
VVAFERVKGRSRLKVPASQVTSPLTWDSDARERRGGTTALPPPGSMEQAGGSGSGSLHLDALDALTKMGGA